MMIVEELKYSILASAFSGNLSVHHVEDTKIENVKKAIEKNHQNMIDRGIIKREKINPIQEKEAPYSIPDHWVWDKLYFVIDVRDGTHDSPKYYDKGIPLVTSKNLNADGTLDLDNIKYISNEDANIIDSRSKVDNGDILYAMIGSIGNPVKVNSTERFCIKNMALFKNPIKEYLNNDYLYYYLKFSQTKMKQESSGGVQQFVSLSYLRNYSIPIPPPEEQQRIVRKLDELFEKLDQVKPIEDDIENIKTRFPEEMRKAILMHAISGKIVQPQQKHFMDKTILPKATSIIEPFEIPENWEWFSHNDLFEIVGGSQPPKSKFSDQMKDGYIQLYQTRDYGNNPQPVYVSKKDVSKFSKKGDIILARYGGSLGKVFWAEDGAYNVALAKVVIKYPELIDNKYLYYYYMASLYQNKVKNSNRCAQAGFSKEDLNDLPFPLPPLEEQKMIVEKIEEILPILEKVKNI